MGFTQNILANTLLHTYTQLIVLQTRFPVHTLLTKEKNLDFIFIGSKVKTQKKVKNAFYIMTYSVASFDAMQKM